MIGGVYLGSVYALGAHPAGVEDSLRRAQETIRVVVAPSLAAEVAGRAKPRVSPIRVQVSNNSI